MGSFFFTAGVLSTLVLSVEGVFPVCVLLQLNSKFEIITAANKVFLMLFN